MIRVCSGVAGAAAGAALMRYLAAVPAVTRDGSPAGLCSSPGRSPSGCHTPPTAIPAQRKAPAKGFSFAPPSPPAPRMLANARSKQAAVRGRVKLPPVYPSAAQALSPLRLPDSAPLSLETRILPLQLRAQAAAQLPSSLQEPQPQTPAVQLPNGSPYDLCSSFACSPPSQPERGFAKPRSPPFPRQCQAPSPPALPDLSRLQGSIPSHATPLGRALPGSARKVNCSKVPAALRALGSLTPSMLREAHRLACGAGTPALSFGATWFGSCPHDEGQEMSLSQPGWLHGVCPSGWVHPCRGSARGGTMGEDQARLP